MKTYWQWKTFDDLADPKMLYQVLQLRQQVFIIEQNCIYPDIDGQDKMALHLLGWADAEQISLVAYARLFLPLEEKGTVSFGRVVVDPAFRRLGLGDQLMAQILTYLQGSFYSQQAIVISAQSYLIQFYQKFGFKQVGEPYDEDGILHVKMIRNS